ADALAAFPESRVIQALQAAFKDPAWAVRMNAANALGEIGDKTALPSLAALQHDHCQSVRGAASRAHDQIMGIPPPPPSMPADPDHGGAGT
ncbi:MAG TPA: HEAT repeat domain-containing protein, partial [Vicinamibacteria bacterium]|nr:HEAT repeat domain-containing protein [Vicinamibacteria bacterium]